MSRIDLSHNSAPLRGGMRPSLEEVNILLRHDPLVVWDCPKATSAATANKKYFWVKIFWLAAFVGMGVAGFLVFRQGAAHSVEKPSETQQHPVPVAKKSCRYRQSNTVCTSCYASLALNLSPISDNWRPRA